MSLPDSLADFEGGWRLSRTIHDARAGQIVRAEGEADLTRSGDGLIYTEKVTLRIPDQADLTGTRRYFWRSARTGVAVFFDDDRYFHTLNLGSAQASDHHDCPPDSYDAFYDFGAWPSWKVRWIVAGPRKSYEMDTEYVLR